MKLLDDKSSYVYKDIEAKTRTDCVAVLYQQPLVAVAGNIIMALLMSWVLWGVTNPLYLWTWFSLHCMVAIPRVILLRQFKQLSNQDRQASPWARYYGFTFLCAASVWGFGSLLVIPEYSLQHQIAILLFLMCMMNAVTWSVFINFRLAMASVCVLLIPVTVWLVLHHGVEITPVVVLVCLITMTAKRALKANANIAINSFKRSHQLDYARQVAEQLAMTDELTGLSNRRAFMARATEFIHYCQHKDDEVCIIMFDIDHFKRINDTYGHAIGDDVLRSIGRLLMHSGRNSDITGRLGGEEFGVVLPDTPLKSAWFVAESLKSKLENLTFDMVPELHLQVTASFGVAAASTSAYNLKATLKSADDALYQAKLRGRNQVVFDHDSSGHGPV